VNDLQVFYESVRSWLEGASERPVFVERATGRPAEPYCVIEPRWLSEPDVGGELTAEPAAQMVAFHLNSYGRRQTDALWLDEVLYGILVDDPIPSLDVQVIFREGDSSPVLTFTRTGHILSKHTYRLAYR
jgi:hypothetical protein